MNFFLFSRQLGRRPHKGFGVISVEVEEEFQPLQLRLETCRAVTEIDGGVLLRVARGAIAARLADKDFPVAWIKTYHRGRVYYSVLGHSPAMFWNPSLLQHFLAGIQYALGDLKADATPTARLASGNK